MERRKKGKMIAKDFKSRSSMKNYVEKILHQNAVELTDCTAADNKNSEIFSNEMEESLFIAL